MGEQAKQVAIMVKGGNIDKLNELLGKGYTVKDKQFFEANHDHYSYCIYILEKL